MMILQIAMLVFGMLYAYGGGKVNCDLTFKAKQGAAVLKEGIKKAPDKATICLGAGVYDFSSMPAGFLLIENKSLTIMGRGADTVLTGFNGFMIESTKALDIRFERLTIKTMGSAIDARNAIVHLSLNGVVIREGTSAGGGGIFIGHGDLDAENSAFIYNVAVTRRHRYPGYGSVLWGNMITHANFMENLGRAITLKAFKNKGFRFHNCIFQDNRCDMGTLFINGDLDLENCLFVSNSLQTGKKAKGGVLLSEGKGRHTVRIRKSVVVDQCDPDMLDLGNSHLHFDLHHVVLPTCVSKLKGYSGRKGLHFQDIVPKVVPGTDFRAAGLPQGIGPDVPVLLKALGIPGTK